MANDIKHLIETSKSFGILLEETAEDYEILAKDLLIKILSRKQVPVVGFPCDKETYKEKWGAIVKISEIIPLPHKTSIKLPKEKYDIKEVSYEESANNLSLVITSKKGQLLKDELVFENLLPQVDALICFLKDESRVNLFKNCLQIPGNEKIIFIKNNQKTLTEEIFELSKTLEPNPLYDQNTSTLFLAMLLEETNNLTEKINKELLILGSLLLEKGAQIEMIREIRNIDKTKGFHLLGRLLARTYIDETLQTSWSFINRRDFQKTNKIATAYLLNNLLKQVKQLVPKQKFRVIIWQNGKGINAIMAANEQQGEKEILSMAQKIGVSSNNNFFPMGPFESFSQAEIKIRQILRENAKNSFTE